MPRWGKGRKLDFIQSQKIRFYSKSGSFLSGQGIPNSSLKSMKSQGTLW